MLQVLSQVVTLNRAGKTIILSTHDLDRIMGYADRLILMNQGAVIQDGLFASVIRQADCAGLEMPCACRMEAVYG
jgi:biotin transport system ATP-binding protein